MKKTLFKFPSGHRFVTTGGIQIEFNGYSPDENIDLTDATEEEFKKIRTNTHDDKYINDIIKKIDKLKIKE